MDNSIGSLFFSHILVMSPVNSLVSSSLLFLQNNTIHLCLPLSFTSVLMISDKLLYLQSEGLTNATEIRNVLTYTRPE